MTLNPPATCINILCTIIALYPLFCGGRTERLWARIALAGDFFDFLAIGWFALSYWVFHTPANTVNANYTWFFATFVTGANYVTLAFYAYIAAVSRKLWSIFNLAQAVVATALYLSNFVLKFDNINIRLMHLVIATIACLTIIIATYQSKSEKNIF